MTALREPAKAKLNLTLRVLGRRPDGFHEIESLVAFASHGDELSLDPDGDFRLSVDGPFAQALSGPNLVETAATAAKSLVPGLGLGHFHLRKAIPVAGGLGGGSADAAAALRLLARANPSRLDNRALRDLAGRLGSDVTVCLESQPALITGRGEVVTQVAGMPACGVVLVNPGARLETARVYAALASPAVTGHRDEPDPPDFGGSFDALIDYAGARGNDLEPAALALAPAVGDVLDALSPLEGARLVGMSGSGPTCFALLASAYEAKRAAAAMQSVQPQWWILAGTLGEGDTAALPRADTSTV